MKNQRKNYFIKPGFQTKLTVIILLIVVIVANIVGGVIYGLLSGSTIVDQIARAFDIDNYRDLLLPVILFAELVAIIIVTFIGIFVSHTMAGPVYRFEKVLDDVANGELDSHFNLRTSDEFQELAASINKLIGTLNSKVAEIKVYSNNITNLMNEIDSPKAMTIYDIENIKNTVQKLNASINYFKMIDVSPAEERSATGDFPPVEGTDYRPAQPDDSVKRAAEVEEKKSPISGAKLSSEDLIGVVASEKKRRQPKDKEKEKAVNAKVSRGGESKKRSNKRG